MDKIRLQKFFTDCGILSRRAAEEEIRQGRVLVNGAVASVGDKIDPENDIVTYQGREIVYPQNAAKHYILLNKPRGFVTSMADEKGRQTVADLVSSLGARVYPVGRLDMDSDGLLLLTNDGDLTLRLTHPRHEIPKLYHVLVKGEISTEQLERLCRPFLMDGYETLPVAVKLLKKEKGATLLSFLLYEGRNRQIRRMCEEVGIHILQLTRVAIGTVTMGDLPVGHYRKLTPDEVSYLKGEKNTVF
jgi:23S rRNA pseudouridine2605 synthase